MSVASAKGKLYAVCESYGLDEIGGFTRAFLAGADVKREALRSKIVEKFGVVLEERGLVERDEAGVVEVAEALVDALSAK